MKIFKYKSSVADCNNALFFENEEGAICFSCLGKCRHEYTCTIGKIEVPYPTHIKEIPYKEKYLPK